MANGFGFDETRVTFGLTELDLIGSNSLSLKRMLQLAVVGLTMRRVPVDSSSIAAIGCDPESRILEVEFRQSGKIYRYFGVPAADYVAFLSAGPRALT